MKIAAMFTLLILFFPTAAYASFNAAYDRGDYAKAMQEVTPVADQGDAKAQTLLGLMHENGQGVQKDYTKALEWYEKGAAQDYTIAQYSIGLMYFNGYGVSQDYSKALEWFRKAASQGEAIAQYSIGLMYFNGQGVEQDYLKAAEWFQKAADQGDVKAQHNMGAMYLKGNGVPQDYLKAVEWFQKAADQGDAVAQNIIGDMYFKGNGVPQDYLKAVKWFQKAADQGDAEAERNLIIAEGAIKNLKIASAAAPAVDYGGWGGSERGSAQDVKPKDSDGDLIGGKLTLFALAAVAFGLYFLPAIIASSRSHPNSTAITLLNLFLGWTALGWIVALIWANTAIRKDIEYID